ncbi:glycerophosphodiester phosphodiesterase family protein [Aquibium sp. A9E412]|uniref:glycerophosphodiester phosphodiesterase family protein n=1 Tax=Aquibium sp. A9E412 TaxID=2976767 RepID=UPI0025B2669E|nr:glycerophosphodiester phosphodiesterase family protein [Aquibium sp. A9E412]MDN2564713.1 glycerophosphodiester phosphodiesterase family protein [Aquibium sp. A9E412]
MAAIEWLTRRPIAHRGLHDLNRTRWENTPSAFAAACAAGYPIECDVQLAADGTPVVFHDDALKRLTGTQGMVWERSAAALGQLAVGGTADRVPTLAAMLAEVAGRVPLVIELKAAEGHDEPLPAAVAALLARYRGAAAVMSFAPRLVRDLAARIDDRPVGLTAHGRDDEAVEAHFAMLAHGIAFTSYHVADLPNRFVGFVRQRLAMPVISWTVRDAATAAHSAAHADQITFEGFVP